MSRLWVHTMPHLTGDIFLEEAKAMNLMLYGQMVNLSEQQWEELEERCRVRLKWPTHWKQARWHKMMQQVKALGWGTKYGPELMTDYSADSPVTKRPQMRKRVTDTQQDSQRLFS